MEGKEYKDKYKQSLIKDRPEFIATPEKTMKWLKRKPEGFIPPIPLPPLIECLICFKVYSADEYRAHKRQ